MGGVSTGNARCDRGLRAERSLVEVRLRLDELADRAEREPVFTPPGRPGAAPFERDRDVERDELVGCELACERVPRRDSPPDVMAYLLPKLSNGRIHQAETRSLSPHPHQPCLRLQRLLQQFRQEY
ncbi:MAG: hypothetical protein RLZ18_322 [Actinomycetota bacterium]